MRTAEVIRHLEELWATAQDRDKRDALHIAVEILRRTESERRPQPQIVTTNFPPVSLEDESA